jgi:hypothetical protein
MHDSDNFFAVPWAPDRGHLGELLDEICVDAYDPSEQVMGIYTAFEEWAGLPKPATVAGRAVHFEGVEDRDEVLAATVVRVSERFSVPLEDVRPLDGTPAAFLVAAYRLWRGLDPISPMANDAGMPQSTALGWHGARERLESWSVSEVVVVVGDLYALSQANRAIVHAKLGLDAPETDLMLLSETKSKLVHYVAPGGDDPFQLDAALDIVEHYTRQTGDHQGTMELLVAFLESGNSAIEAYGDLFSEFYEAMVDATWRCCEALEDGPSLIDQFRPRLEALLPTANLAGRGYDEALGEVLAQLDWDDDEDSEAEQR